MDKATLTTYAKHGIVARRRELEAELEQLRTAEHMLNGRLATPRRRRELTEAEKAAVSKRMKRYWAERRRQQK